LQSARAGHVDHEKRVAWFSISLHAHGSVPIVMVILLVALQATGALLLKPTKTSVFFGI